MLGIRHQEPTLEVEQERWSSFFPESGREKSFFLIRHLDDNSSDNRSSSLLKSEDLKLKKNQLKFGENLDP